MFYWEWQLTYTWINIIFTLWYQVTGHCWNPLSLGVWYKMSKKGRQRVVFARSSLSSLCPRCFRVGLPLGAHPHPNLRSNLLPHNLLVFFYCTATCALSLCSKCLLRKFSTQLVRRFRNSAYCPTQVFHLHLVLVPYAVLLFRLVLFTLWL